MAVLQKLRDHGKLVAIAVGLALALFIVGDMIKSGQALWGQKQNYIAEVNGQPIDYQEYEAAMEEAKDYYKTMTGQKALDDQTLISLRTQVWDQLILSKILEQVKEKTGLTITKEELADMVLGKNPDPLVEQIFRNPQTGYYDPNFAKQVLMNLDRDPELKKFWLYIEKNLKLKRLADKYVNLISKAILATKFDAKVNYIERSKLYDLAIGKYPYTKVPDTLITVSEDEMKEYYEKNKNRFYQSEETRKILYIVFPILPSAQDSAKLLSNIEKLKPEFEKTNKPIEFVNLNSEHSYVDKFYTKKELPKPIDSLFFATNDSNIVYGPFIYQNSYTLARLLERQTRPDTVTFRHILISPQDQRIKTIDRAEEVADSLLQAIKNGADFDKLVREYSADQGSINNGGRYENVTEGQMVPEINDFIFSGKTGDIKIIKTRFGVHIVEILDQKSFEPKVKVAFLRIDIQPGKETFDKIYREAALFRSSCKQPSDFEKIAQQKGYIIREANNLTQGTFVIPGLNYAREIVRWAFKANVGDISNIFSIDNNKYIVVKLQQVVPAGYAPFELVKDFIKQQLINQKKGQYILNLIKKNNIPTNDVNAFAKAAGTDVINAQNVSFNAFAIYGVGNEPVIFGSLDLLKPNKPFGPLAGKQAVYLEQATSITVPPEPSDEQLSKTETNLTQGYRQRIAMSLFDKIKRDYEIKDYRIRFQ